jgi:hypothetical protein
MSEGWLHWVDFRGGGVVIFVFDARKVEYTKDAFDNELDDVEFTGKEEARGGWKWGSVHRFNSL